MEISGPTRRYVNAGLGCVHGVLALWALATPRFRVQLGEPVPQWNDTAAADVVADTRLTAQCDYSDPDAPVLDVPQLCFCFFAITCAAHAFYAARADEYEALVRAERMWWRWVEYAASVPFMLAIISLLNGLTLSYPLLQTATLGSVTQYFGYAAEAQAVRDRSLGRLTHLLGFPVLAVALAPVSLSFWNVVESGEAPDFVPVVIVTQTLFFSSFGFVQSALLFGRGGLTYRAADTVYLFLSLACKASLGASVLAALATFS